MRLLVALVLLLALSACSSGNDAPKAEPKRAPSSSPSAPDRADASGTDACAEVRAGIDAFNTGDFAATVGHFKLALPLARAQADSDSSQAADDLVESVRYYAELAPEDYAESARSSPDFVKYKTITLGQCVTPTTPLEDGPSGSPGVTA